MNIPLWSRAFLVIGTLLVGMGMYGQFSPLSEIHPVLADPRLPTAMLVIGGLCMLVHAVVFFMAVRKKS